MKKKGFGVYVYCAGGLRESRTIFNGVSDDTQISKNEMNSNENNKEEGK